MLLLYLGLATTTPSLPETALRLFQMLKISKMAGPGVAASPL